jgi:hypothetical protein
MNDEMKKKRKKKENLVNRNSRSTDQRTCSIERVIEFEDDSKQI